MEIILADQKYVKTIRLYMSQIEIDQYGKRKENV